MKPTYTHLALAIATCFPMMAAAQSTDTAVGKLPDVTVTETVENPYRPDAANSGTRTATEIEKIPQSISVVTKKTIKDQEVTKLSDALRNASNVTQIDEREANIVGFRVRGFHAATVIDGVNAVGYFAAQENVRNLEQADVLKGPAANLFGATQSNGAYPIAGGMVALTTKQPQMTNEYDVGMRMGSHGERSANVDLNHVLSSDWAVRLNGEIERKNSETDSVYFKNKALFPSVTWSPDADTKVVARFRFADRTNLDYSGLPTNGTLNTSSYTVPRNRFITADGMPETKLSQRGANVQWTQVLNPNWTFGLTTAYQKTLLDEQGVFPFPYGGAGPVYVLGSARMWEKFSSYNISPSVTGKFDTGSVKHTLNLGVDHETVKDNASMLWGMLPSLYDINNPVNPTWVDIPLPSAPYQQNRYRSSTIYAQDQASFGALQLLGSLRYSHLNIKDQSTDPMWTINNQTSTNQWTPRVGLTYEITPAFSAFTGYNQAVRVPIVSVYSTPPKAEKSNQTEIGVRLKNWHGLTASAAWFDLNRKNATVADPDNMGYSIQVGRQNSKGVDVDLQWQATPAFSLLGALTVQKVRVAQDTNASLQGKRLFNVPERSARLAARYDFKSGSLRGMGLGLGASSRGKLAGDGANNYFTPGVTVWDAQISYKMGDMRFGLSVQNLLNKKYYEPANYFGGGQVIPGTDRTVHANVNWSF